MSRLTGNDARSLMEAYAAVYAPQITEEQVWEEVEEWVNSLVEEGYDLSEYSWEEMYEAYIEEVWDTGSARAAQLDQRRRNIEARGGQGGRLYRAINRAFGTQVPEWDKADRDDRRREQAALNRASNPNWKPERKEEPRREEPRREEPRREPRRDEPAETRTPTPPPAPARPAAGAPTGKPAPAASTPARASSPANATNAQKIAGGMEVWNKQKAAGDFASADKTGRQVWALANPKLAAADAERKRIRGTQQTDNPLMKDFRSRLPMNSPSVQSPDVANLGKGFQSLTQNPNALKAAPAKPAPAAATPAKPTPAPAAAAPAASTPAKPAPAPAAAAPVAKPAPKPIPAATGSKKPGSIVSHYDPFDVVIGHLLDEGYADSEESALAIMANMSEEWKNSIIQK